MWNKMEDSHRTAQSLETPTSHIDGGLLTLLFLFLQGIQAEETAFLFPPLRSPAPSSDRRGSFLGRICRGGILARAVVAQQYISGCGRVRECNNGDCRGWRMEGFNAWKNSHGLAMRCFCHQCAILLHLCIAAATMESGLRVNRCGPSLDRHTFDLHSASLVRPPDGTEPTWHPVTGQIPWAGSNVVKAHKSRLQRRP